MITTPSLEMDAGFPYLAAPLLKGQLKKAGYNTTLKDYSVEFHDDILQIGFIKKIYKKLKKIEKKYQKKDDKDFKKMHKIYNHLLKVLKRKKEISPWLRTKSLEFVMFPFNNVIINEYINKKDYSFSSIWNFCFDKETNFYTFYLEEKIKNIPKFYDVICVSKFPDHDLIGILTLCRILKEKFKNKKIVLGGYWFTPILDDIKKYPEFFDYFCDYLMIKDGENAIVELMEHIDNKRELSQVSNVVYKNKENEIIVNPELSKVKINDLAYADYSDYDFNKYIEKEPFISIMLSKGCYWGKCKFCTYSRETPFQIKTIDNAIKEIKHYVEKYNIKGVFFTDDAIKPQYYERLADKLIQNNIKLNISSYAIMDEGFTLDILEKCAKAGVNKLTWGFETNSKKVFDICNKSGCFEKRDEILKNSHKAGIKNVLNVIEALPGENFDDLLKTVKFIYDNAQYIDILSIQQFQLRLGSEFVKNPEFYGLEISEREEFALNYRFNYKYCELTNENSYFYWLISKTGDSICKNPKLIKRVTKEYLEHFAPELL